MTFNTNVPNATESPGVFPNQNQANYTRLKTIVNAEHVFNDSAQATDGVHRQMTMVARTDPVALPAGTNGMLYTKIVAGAPEVFFFDGTDIVQISNAVSGAVSVVGAATIAVGADTSVFNPAYNWAGTGWAYKGGLSIFYNIIRVGATTQCVEINHQGLRGVSLAFSGTDLRIFNQLTAGGNDVKWSLIINQLV